MRISNFWLYTIMVMAILHIVIGFAYLLYKLSPKKNDKEDEIVEKDAF